jgi:tetratricopeptide (TPR) repeat protein
MIPLSREDEKKKAFCLFEDGRYSESLSLCTKILAAGKDPAIEVLAATNLFSDGRLDDAEVHFRDLALRMPDSSYVHSYLAKVLEARGDEGAVAEYVTAVHLDPTNQDALRSYAAYLLAREDYRSSLPVLRRLVQISRKPEDVQNLMRALTGAGEADEALATFRVMGEGAETSHEYTDALVAAGDLHAAAKAALEIWRRNGDVAALRKYLDATARTDPPSALEEYAQHLGEHPDRDILFDYIRLLRSHGRYGEASEAARSLCGIENSAMHRLIACDLLAEAGRDAEAVTGYEQLVRDELTGKNDLGELETIIGHYRTVLLRHAGQDEAERRFLGLVSGDINVASLLETARFYESVNRPAEARSWYYRAYRADFLTGGLAYARFLAASGDSRECEKVMLYILSNVRKGPDIHRVATIILDRQTKMYELRRLMDQLIKKLEARQSSLNSEGRDLLAMSFFIAASNALDEADYTGCKYLCLCGIDVLPVPPRAVKLEDFLELVRACKARSVVDRPVLHQRVSRRKSGARPAPAAPSPMTTLELSGPEKKIVEFLQAHHRASEMDLRKVLGTRRVVGIVNQLIKKAADDGVSLIEKKGVGDEGEMYEYTGT